MFSKQNSERKNISLPLATKLSLITVCKGWVVSTQSFSPTSALKNVHVVTQKLDLDQMWHLHMLKNIDKTNIFNGKTVLVTEGWYRNISLVPVLHTDSLNNLVEALYVFVCACFDCVLVLCFAMGASIWKNST